MSTFRNLKVRTQISWSSTSHKTLPRTALATTSLYLAQADTEVRATWATSGLESTTTDVWTTWTTLLWGSYFSYRDSRFGSKVGFIFGSTDVRVGTNLGQFGPKWDKFGNFLDQIQYILSQNVMNLIWKNYRICFILGLFDPTFGPNLTPLRYSRCIWTLFYMPIICHFLFKQRSIYFSHLSFFLSFFYQSVRINLISVSFLR